MQKFIWLLAIACLPLAHYGCSAQTSKKVDAPPQSNKATPLPTALSNEPIEIDSSRNENSAINTIRVYPPDPNTGGQIYSVYNKDQSCDLIFKDAKTQKVLRTIHWEIDEMPELDTYLKLPYTTTRGTKLVDLTKLTPQQKQDLTAGMHIDSYNTSPDKEAASIILGELGVETNYHNVAIAYGIICYNKDGFMLGTKGNIVVIDATGKQRCIINDAEHGTIDMSFTDNGKYLMKKYGYLLDEGEPMEIGYKIYELTSGKLLLHYPTNLNPQIFDCGEPYSRGNLLCFACSTDGFSIITLFDPASKKYYTRKSNNENRVFVDFTPQGIRLNDGSTLLYEKDFEKHNFNQ